MKSLHQKQISQIFPLSNQICQLLKSQSYLDNPHKQRLTCKDKYDNNKNNNKQKEIQTIIKHFIHLNKQSAVKQLQKIKQLLLQSFPFNIQLQSYCIKELSKQNDPHKWILTIEVEKPLITLKQQIIQLQQSNQKFTQIQLVQILCCLNSIYQITNEIHIISDSEEMKLIDADQLINYMMVMKNSSIKYIPPGIIYPNIKISKKTSINTTLNEKDQLKYNKNFKFSLFLLQIITLIDKRDIMRDKHLINKIIKLNFTSYCLKRLKEHISEKLNQPYNNSLHITNKLNIQKINHCYKEPFLSAYKKDKKSNKDQIIEYQNLSMNGSQSKVGLIKNFQKNNFNLNNVNHHQKYQNWENQSINHQNYQQSNNHLNVQSNNQQSNNQHSINQYSKDQHSNYTNSINKKFMSLGQIGNDKVVQSFQQDQYSYVIDSKNTSPQRNPNHHNQKLKNTPVSLRWSNKQSPPRQLKHRNSPLGSSNKFKLIQNITQVPQLNIRLRQSYSPIGGGGMSFQISQEQMRSSQGYQFQNQEPQGWQSHSRSRSLSHSHANQYSHSHNSPSQQLNLSLSQEQQNSRLMMNQENEDCCQNQQQSGQISRNSGISRDRKISEELQMFANYVIEQVQEEELINVLSTQTRNNSTGQINKEEQNKDETNFTGLNYLLSRKVESYDLRSSDIVQLSASQDNYLIESVDNDQDEVKQGQIRETEDNERIKENLSNQNMYQYSIKNQDQGISLSHQCQAQERYQSTTQLQQNHEYVGQLNHQGLKHGLGRLVYSDGGYYEGSWNKGQIHGFGKLYYPSGNLAYAGYWNQGCFHGPGLILNQNQQLTLKKDQLNKDGEDSQIDYQDLDQLSRYWLSYRGNFEMDVRQGHGQVKLCNGDLINGCWQGNKINGQAQYKKRDGTIIKGIWKDNKLEKIFMNNGKEQIENKSFQSQRYQRQ